jgi:fused signal recognition particle receptor
LVAAAGNIAPMFFKKLRDSLANTTKALTGRIRAIVKGRKIDEALWTEVEEILITSDVGVAAADDLVGSARKAASLGIILSGDDLVPWLRKRMVERLTSDEKGIRWAKSGPTVILIAGVNGSGKTTSIAKLTKWLTAQKKTVMVAACDTFRAAAVDQLGIWAERLGVAIVRKPTGADPSAVAFDAAEAAVKQGVDVLIVDTAGRLHTQKNLMEELSKINRVLGKRIPGAPHETLLVLDGTAGQNGLQQTQRFREHSNVTGLVVSKLDGTAKGGVVLSIRDQIGVPVKFVGTGESADDFAPFDAETFVAALFGDETGRDV